MAREKVKPVEREYNCPWCNTVFKQFIIYDPNFDSSTMKQKKKGIISTQVKCPKCLNFIPTWKKEEIKNVIGRKHIHLR